MEMMPRTGVGIDLSRFDPRSRVRDEADPTGGMGMDGLNAHLRVKKQSEARAVKRLRDRTLARSQLLMATAAAVLLVVTMLFGIVFSTMQLSTLTSEATKLRRINDHLAGQEANLRAQVENRIDLAEIERIAIEELGMMKPRGELIVYVDTSSADYAVVYSENGVGALARVWRMLTSLF